MVNRGKHSRARQHGQRMGRMGCWLIYLGENDPEGGYVCVCASVYVGGCMCVDMCMCFCVCVNISVCICVFV